MDYMDIIRALPEPVRQFSAGIGTIPSETGRAVAMVANPARTYRQITGTATPEDNTGIVADIQRRSDQWNETVNEALALKDPSILDNTGSAAARFLGGAAVLPTRAITALPAGIRHVAKLAELLTPLTITHRTGAARIAPVAANVAVPMVAGGAVEKGMEPFDPTLPRVTTDLDGNVVERYTPLETAGTGRVIARAVADQVRENPVGTAAAAGGAVALTLLARGHNRRLGAVRDASSTSDVNVPLASGPANDIPVPMGKVERGAAGITELTQDANVQLKKAVEQALPNDAQRAAQINSFTDLATEQAHKSRVQQAREGIIETPEGLVRTVDIKRLAEELTHASTKDVHLKREVDDLLSIRTELDNREAHQRAVDALRQKVDPVTGRRLWTDERIARETNHLVEVDTNRPIYNANGMQRVMNGQPVWVKDYIIPRATLHDFDDMTLRSRAQQLTNARTSPWVDKYWQYHKDVLNSLVKYGALGANEEAYMLRANPHYRHTNNFEEAKSPFTTRLRGHMEGPATAGDPWDASREYVDHAMDFAYRNMRTRETVDALLEAKAAGRSIGDVIGNVRDPRQIRRMTLANNVGVPGRPMRKTDIPMSGDILRYKVGGDIVEVEIKNKALFQSMSTMPKHTQTVFGWIRGVAESGMTGKLATLMGQPFALANATMGAMFAMITRPKNLGMGVIDRSLLRATAGLPRVFEPILGKKLAAHTQFGFRGDPTAYVGMAATAVKNVSLVMGKAFSDSLRNSIAANGTLSKIIPNAPAVADRLGNVWRESMYAQQFRHGAGDVNTLGGQGIDTTSRSSVVAGMEHTEQARIVDPTKPQDFKRYLQTLGQTAVPADAKIAWRLMGDIQSAIANAPQSYAYASNKAGRLKGLTPEQAFREAQSLSAQVRQLLGDSAMKGTGLRDFQQPGTSIARKLVGRGIDMSPYANIGIQATGRMIHAFKTDFVGTTAAVAAVMGPLAIAPIVRMYQIDEERAARGEERIYLPWLIEQPAWFKARFAVVPMDGVAPDRLPTVRIDPLLSIIMAPAVEAVLMALGVSGNRDYEKAIPPIATPEQVAEYADDRRWQTIRKGILNASPISQPPTWMTGLYAATGQQLGSFDDILGRGGALQINQRGMGGYAGTTLQGGWGTKRIEAFFQAVFPGLAATLGGMLTAGQQAERRQPGTAIPAALSEMGQRSRDRLNEGNSILFSQPRRRTTQDPAADMVNAREEGMKAIRDNRSSLTGEGTVGSGNQRELAPGGGRAGVADREMQNILYAIDRGYTRFQQGLIAQRTKERELLMDVAQRGIVDANERRQLENQHAERISQINHQLLLQYQRFERELSNYTGRRIRLDKIDPAKPITQFPVLER